MMVKIIPHLAGINKIYHHAFIITKYCQSFPPHWQQSPWKGCIDV